MNTFTLIFLGFLAAGVVVQWLLVNRHIRHIRQNRAQVPAAFRGKIPLAAHHKAADYTRAKAKTNLADLIQGAVFILLWTLAGGLQWLDTFWRAFELPALWHGTFFILSVFAIMSALNLPLSLYRTFKLEAAFGFNRMTPRVFLIDLLKNALLGLAIGAPLLLLVLWIMDSGGAWWWLYVWLTWLGFSLLMMWAYPAFIAPFFNTFRPLQNAELKTRIENLLSRNGFKSQGIFVMDGSTRSTHGNAYFTGLGANKRIVFFDTLIDELSHAEIEAVLAHELGHFKCHHIRKRIMLMGVIFLIGLALLGWFINEAWFFNGLGVAEASNHMALTLFLIASPAFYLFPATFVLLHIPATRI